MRQRSVILILTLILAGCGRGVPQVTSTVAPSPTSTTGGTTIADVSSPIPIIQLTNTATLTALPSLTFTPTPSATPTNTLTRSATSTNTLTPSATPPKPPTATPTLSPEEAALQLALTPVVSNAAWTPFEKTQDKVTMVLVPAGRFKMGSDNSAYDREKPANEQIFTTPFWIDKYEVTNEQFTQFKGVAQSTSYLTEAKHPRESITWFEARDFCELRGARLATEREWEYAARGPDDLEYPWGPTWNANNVVQNSRQQTADVGSRPTGASWVGAEDLSGNVWEWVSTIYGIDKTGDYNFSAAGEKKYTYPYTADDGREQNSDNSTDVRVLRSGSLLNTNPHSFRAAIRDFYAPDFWYFNIGFRCARS